MAATIYEVAALAGVSPATVSRVLNGAAVSPGYAAKVREAANALNFRPNRTARTLRRQSSEIIALIIPDIENPFYTALARGVEDRALAAGYSVVLCNTDDQHDKEARYLDIAISEHMAGVVLAPASANTDIDALLARNTPVVTVDRSTHGHAVDAVLMDNTDGGRTATAALYDQGFMRVACITGPRDVETADQRAEGWREVFIAHSPRLKADNYLRRANYRVDGGRAAMADLMRMRRPPDAVFVANNLMSVGALQHLLSIDKEPPAIGLASLGDLPFTTWERKGVTVLPWPGRRLGITAADLLLSRIGGDHGPARTIITRGSDDDDPAG
ncbi:MAG: LacI family transcriptional regulator [Actinomycetota bacterium]|jgi:LacI family transcriptional regulator|nr:LacI family transcriptional regulator [Actinomycetota bacterium]MDQ1670364.1 LacI family transcriptional regulator [Actinomycetota bacterium]